MSRSKSGKEAALLAGCVVVVVMAVVAWRFPHIRFRYLFESLGKNAQGYSEYRHRQTGIIFVKLPGGTFTMGSPEAEDLRSEDEKQHEVVLSSFMIAKYEVTQSQWGRVMEINPSHFKGHSLPVESVTWDECQVFCRKTGLALPTEAQWEYACRAGEQGPFARSGDIDGTGWVGKNSEDKTHTVGQKKPNNFGLHDMHGNVFEWCEDAFDKEFFSKPEATEENPICTSGSGDRVIRGGCFEDDAGLSRSAARTAYIPSDRNDEVGFRPACSFP